MTAFALRGSLGASYTLTETTSLGIYYQSVQRFRFKDEVPLEAAQWHARFSARCTSFAAANRGHRHRQYQLDGWRTAPGRRRALHGFMRRLARALFAISTARNGCCNSAASTVSMRETRISHGLRVRREPDQSERQNLASPAFRCRRVPAVEYLQAQMAIINQRRHLGGRRRQRRAAQLGCRRFRRRYVEGFAAIRRPDKRQRDSWWESSLGFTWRFDQQLLHQLAAAIGQKGTRRESRLAESRQHIAQRDARDAYSLAVEWLVQFQTRGTARPPTPRRSAAPRQPWRCVAKTGQSS